MSNNYRIRIKKGVIEFEVEGDKEFVEKMFEEFKTETENVPISNTGNTEILTGQEEQSILKNHSIQKIYKSLSLKTNLDRILFFGYWISKVDGKKEFSIDDTIEYFIKFSLSKPAYPKRDFRNLVNKRGYLIIGSNEDLYSISYDGINDIEEKLNKLEIK